MSAAKIGIIGFGFSGLMVTANLVRNAVPDTVIYIVAEDLHGLGMAYSTTNPLHLLNVPAGKMGAFAEAIDGFHLWLQTADAALAKQALGLTTAYAATDFAPRALYGAYLQSLWRDTQALASERHVQLKLVETAATCITPDAILTGRGDAIAVDAIVLATGNETRPVLAHLPPGCVVQNPWTPGAFDGAAQWPSPVVLMGAGLTAVDTVLSLRSTGYHGKIVAYSRHGYLPLPHASATRIFAFDAATLTAQKSLPALLRFVRRTIAEQGGEWRVVIDALRPYTQQLWQQFSPRDRQRFLARLLAVWNIHRHRMAPEIAVRMDAEIARGDLRIIAGKRTAVAMVDGVLTITFADGSVLHPTRIINCTGPELNPTKSARNLLTQAVADGMIEMHASQLGIAADPQLRAWGNGYPTLYAMGALLTGQLLESTAVPELRRQAADVAAALIRD